MKSGFPGYYLFIATFLASNFAGFRYLKADERTEHFHLLKLEKMDEETNIISNEIEKKVRDIASIEGKLLRYTNLKDVSESLGAVLNLDEVTKLIIEKAFRTIGKPGRALLFLVDAARQELMLSASSEGAKVKEKKGDIFDRWILKQRKPLLIEDIAKDFRFGSEAADEAKGSFRSLIATPLMSEHRITGIIRMDSPVDFAYTQDDLRLLDIIADLGAVAVQNAALYSRTQELAIRDSLTGLAVRRYFIERLKEDIKRAARKKGTVSLLLMDVDHFKAYNDQYGHAMGDLVLKHVARLINSMVREGDILSRYGGEEMALLLFGADKKQAAIDAEEIRKHVEKSGLNLRRHALQVTLSIGISNYPEDAATEEGLIKAADERLYKAKEKGRNRVCMS
jgi:diguanylate cyclase (GGDEF)-like protein